MMENPRIIYSVSLNVELLAKDLSKALFNTELMDMPLNEKNYVISLSDCFIGKYINDCSPISISTENALPGTVNTASKYFPYLTPDIHQRNIQRDREKILARYNLYLSQSLKNGFTGYHVVVINFSILAHEYEKETSSNYGLPTNDTDTLHYVEVFVNAMNRLVRAVPEFAPVIRNPEMPPHIKNQLYDDQKQTMQQPPAKNFFGKLVKLALIGLGIGFILYLIQK